MPQAKRITFKCDDTFLRMKLPSGRELSYPFARLKTNDRGNTVVTFMDNELGKWVECRHGQGAYGGTWIENAVQAVARDLFAATMPRLEAAGYHIVLHVHDEIVCEVPNDFGNAEEFLHIITAAPDWADGLPIAAKVRNGSRFCKTTTPKPEAVQSDQPADEHPEPDQHEGDEAGGDNGNDEDNGGNDGDNGGGDYSSGERPWGRNLTAYVYRDVDGQPYLKVVRTSAKQFPQYHWDTDRWIKGKPKGPKIPYRLPELLAAATATPIFVCEGERTATTLLRSD
jgi:hypothetical protein